MADDQKKWYVLRAISGKEQNVKEYIELDMKNHGYQEYVSQVLIPQENVVKVQNNKRVEQKRNLLPGYVLVEATSSERYLTCFATLRVFSDSSVELTSLSHFARRKLSVCSAWMR
jgi:transcription antitermination factor NusG